MATATLSIVCLLVAVGAAPAEVYPMNQRAFSVPIKPDPARKHEIGEFVLYSSNDQGRTWNQQAVASPDKTEFQFFAPTDGEYWLSLQVVDKKGKRDPADVSRAAPAMKVLVDTLKPVLRITAAERQGDEIVVGWEIHEEHPDLASLKLEYRGGDALTSQWYTAALIPAMTGQTRFRSPGSGPIEVRLQMKDAAENFGDTRKEVPGVPPPPTMVSQTSAPPPAPTPYTNPSPPPAPAYTPQTYPPPAANPWETAANNAAVQNVPKPPDAGYSPVPNPRYQPATYDPSRAVAVSETISPVGYTSTAPASRLAPRNTPKQLTRSREVSLNYEVRNDGPSGIGKVELWLTEDEGRSWRKYAEELNPATGLGTQHRKITAELPGEGTYGLCLVVLSRAGLGKGPPHKDDPPDIRVEVDLTKPVVILNEPEPDARNSNTILLTWQAMEKNPVDKPVTLEYKDPVMGDWKVIADNQPLTGTYGWKVPQGLQSWVYLRIRARDQVGNEGVAETKEPVLIDLSKPEGHIIGIAR